MAGNKWKARRAEVEALLATATQAEAANMLGISPQRLSAIVKQYRAADARELARKQLADTLRAAADEIDPLEI